MKTERRGGPRKGAGLKSGTKHKNAEKPPEQRHSVKKQVSYTPAQWELIEAKMARLGYNDHTKFARDLLLKEEFYVFTEGQQLHEDLERFGL